MPARNETGSTLTKGTVVYISGGAGNKPLLAKALATGDATSAQTIGLVTADIPNNSNGDVTIRGQLKDIDTSAFSVGAQLYLSGTTAGTYTATKTLAPTHLVYVGIVVRSNATEGAIEVAVQNGYELEELHDVSITSPSNGQVLKYDSTDGLWKNQTDAVGAVTSVAGRTGAVTLAVADVSGAAPLASPTFTGTPSLPTGTTAVTQTLADNSTKLATTAYVDGSIPANSVKAWVNFNGVALTGTYSRTGTLVTVTMTAHGMTTGQNARLDFTTGTATDGAYTVTVTGVNTFTITDTASGTTSGNVTRQAYIRASMNVSSITDNGVGDYTVNFTTAMADANYVPVISMSYVVTYIPYLNTTGGAASAPPTASAFRMAIINTSGSNVSDALYVSAAFFR
jgi:hypothetical protein